MGHSPLKHIWEETKVTQTLPMSCKAVVFDAYGTLFDVHSAVMRHGQRIGTEAAAFSSLWRQKQLEYSWVLSLAGRFADFWTLTERALEYALMSHPGVDRALRPTLLAAYRELAAYQEVPAALRRLRARGLKTAVFSNGEPSMLADAVEAADLKEVLDAVVSVTDVGVFKTHPKAYAHMLSVLGAVKRDIVFVSSNRWDVAGATAFGLGSVWVNRSGAPDEYGDLPPIATLRDLEKL